MRIVAALGGNALLRRGDKPDADTQIRNVQTAAAQLAALAADHELVITHGNGPQVGVLALQSANDQRLSALDCWGFFGQCLFCASGCLLQVQEIAFDLVRGAIP